MGNNHRPLVQGAKDSLNHFKVSVMAKEGYNVDQEHPDHVKYEVAKDVQVPLHKGYNGELSARQAGKVGGNIGGKMVHELIEIAQQSLIKNNK